MQTIYHLAFSPGSSDWHQRAGGDGSSVLRGTAEAEEADRAPEPPTPTGFGERYYWDTVQSGQVSIVEKSHDSVQSSEQATHSCGIWSY